MDKLQQDINDIKNANVSDEVRTQKIINYTAATCGEEVGSLMKRRIKEDHLDGLPEKKVLTYQVDMPKEQLDVYLDIIDKARATLPNQLKGKQHILNTIGALRDASLPRNYVVYARNINSP